MNIDLDRAFGIHADALALRSRRAGLLAGNLANADTPGYKARDLDFRAMLRNLHDPVGNARLEVTHARHLADPSAGSLHVEPMYRVPHQPSVDDNTVDTQIEQAAFLENALAYQTSLTFLGGRIKSLRLAVRGE